MKAHGLRGYWSGCRCDECRDALAAAKRARVASRRGKTPPSFVAHGKPATYTNWACRCDACRKAWNKAVLRRRDARSLRPIPRGMHGLYTTYGNYRCRCAECRAASRKHNADKRARQKASA